MHSNEPKLLPVALKISLANCFSPHPPNLEEGGDPKFVKSHPLSLLLLSPLPQDTAVFPAQLTAADQGRGMGGGKNELLSFFPCRLSWRGGGCFFSWAAHCTPPFPPHPSQCLCKPPRSYTRPLTSAQAMAPPRSVLLTRTVMSLWPPQAATGSPAEAQGMGIRRGFDLELVVRGGNRGRHTGTPSLPTHTPLHFSPTEAQGQTTGLCQTWKTKLPLGSNSSIAKVGQDGLGIACAGCHHPQPRGRNPTPERG